MVPYGNIGIIIKEIAIITIIMSSSMFFVIDDYYANFFPSYETF